MEGTFLKVPNGDVYLVLGILMLFIIIEIISGYLSRTQRKFGDWFQEFGGFLILSLGIKPGIVLIAIALGALIIPSAANFFGESSLLFMTLFYLILDDLMQYWYHRSAHEYPFLWKLHRPHHQAEEMGFFVSYRNAAFYYLFMPNLWWGGICTFLGAGPGVALGLILKQIIIISSHSTISYDKLLYRYKALRPIAWLVEHIFVTPAFHHSHHGKSKIDGSSDPNGNFGNMFSIWDQLFGTASFPHEFPVEYGIPNDPKEHWSAAYLYPVIASKDNSSEISRGHIKHDTRVAEPAEVKLEKGKNYLYCACGKSKSQPFCDGTHHGTKFKPKLFVPKKSGSFKLCQCKMTAAGPFCDNTHLDWQGVLPPIKKELAKV
ncbi:MAG: sterol desaturase family protein [Bacteroidia bacterium]|nr:sterol desaturase family protein [Bacteroidia bacterium]